MEKTLFFDDFSKFPVNPYPSYYFATQEYHYLPPKGYTGSWYESTISYKWRPCSAAWQVIEDDNKKKLLSTLESSAPFNRILITGEPVWSNYKIKLKLQMLNSKGSAGFVFRYQNNREFYCFIIEDKNKIKLMKYCHTEITVLKEIETDNIDEETELEITADDSEITAYLNDKKLFIVNDLIYKSGRAGLIASQTTMGSSG